MSDERIAQLKARLAKLQGEAQRREDRFLDARSWYGDVARQE